MHGAWPKTTTHQQNVRQVVVKFYFGVKWGDFGVLPKFVFSFVGRW